MITGVVPAIVTDNKDPQGEGKIRVRFPGLGPEDTGHWARLATPMAGNGRGIEFLPEIGDEVLVAFERGDATRPYILGGLWNGTDRPPVANADGQNNLRVIHTRSGHLIRFDDSPGAGKIEISLKGGHRIRLDGSPGAEWIEVRSKGGHSILLDDTAKTVTLRSTKDLVLEAPQGEIRMAATTVTMKAPTTSIQGQSVTIQGATSSIQGTAVAIKGTTVAIQADATGSFVATGGLTLNGAPGITAIKGSVVNIN